MKGNSQFHRQHSLDYLHRSQKGVKQLARPWDWLTPLAEVRQLATEAYRAASFGLSDPDDRVEEPREYFVDQLVQAFECLVQGAGAGAGIAGPSERLHYAACLREELPDDWRPQYPV
jgi:hypothetical protein